MGELEQELLQDFLVEGRELLENLDENLVDLEQRPNDEELLNAVFRGFHTLKGGAGFLGIAPMVNLCHRAEALLDRLRQGELRIDAPLMDTILTALDATKAMFATLEQGKKPEDPDPSLYAQLDHYVSAPGAEPETGTEAVPQAPPQTGGTGGVSFETLLAEAANADPPPGTDEAISDEEFETLLDGMYGPGAAPGVAQTREPSPVQQASHSRENTENTPPVPSSPHPEKISVPKPPTENTIRVDAKRLDECLNLVGELVLTRNRLFTLAEKSMGASYADVLANMDQITSGLQNAILKLRMQPIQRVFSRFHRVVRDLARHLGKEVRLELIGEETEVDRRVIEELADPLTHLLRNGLDHGIEPPDEREALNKPREGRLTLRASQQGDHILIEMIDDGRGIDPDRLRRAAVEKGLIGVDNIGDISDEEAYDLMFLPGFSTRAQVSDISGRGVGMDVVRNGITNLNGNIQVRSEPGKGSCFRITLPLTLTILPTLIVGVNGQRFAFPLSRVREVTRLSEHHQHRVGHRSTLVFRGQTVVLFDLRRELGERRNSENPPPEANPQVLIIEAANRTAAIFVDTILGQQDVVVKPLAVELTSTTGISGSSITGDGRIVLILDLDELVRSLLLERAA